MGEVVRIGVMGCGPRGRQMAYITGLLPDCCKLTVMSDPEESSRNLVKTLFPV